MVKPRACLARFLSFYLNVDSNVDIIPDCMFTRICIASPFDL